MDEHIFEQLRSFIVNESGIDDEEITRNTEIEDDLGISGDEAGDFMIAYSKAFEVDVKNFMFADYFSGEGSSLLSDLFRPFIGKKQIQKKSFTVGHLEKGIEFGRLDEEILK